jgi:hypothetical protein
MLILIFVGTLSLVLLVLVLSKVSQIGWLKSNILN